MSAIQALAVWSRVLTADEISEMVKQLPEGFNNSRFLQIALETGATAATIVDDGREIGFRHDEGLQ